MSLFRKPKKNVRSRGPVVISDEEGDDDIEIIQNSIGDLKVSKVW